jgi:hypothetical protein
MSYKPLTIRQAIHRLNRSFFLPSLQREFVWKDKQIIKLFDSVMREYPISSFLFWQPDTSAAKRWQAYQFLDEISDKGSHNSVAKLNGVNRPVFVLDGQQRLTALNIGLRGIYHAKDKYRRWDNLAAYKEKKLFIDLIQKNKEAQVEDQEGDTYYRFSFWEKAPVSTKRSCWFEVGDILNCQTAKKTAKRIRAAIKTLPKSASQNARDSVALTIKKLRTAVFKQPVVFYHTETLPDYDRVLDIFVRANEAGTKLTKSDLLLSTLISNWEHEDARKEVHSFVDHLNHNIGPQNDLDKDFVIKACFVLCDLPVKYDIRSFTRKNLKFIEVKWAEIKDALERCLRLVNRFGINGDNLTSANALIPVAHYLYLNPGETLLGSSRKETRNADCIRQWLTMALLNKVFGGSSDTMLSSLRDVMQRYGRNGKDFPVERLNAAISQRGRSATFDEKSIDNLLALEHGDTNTFLALTLLYDDTAWGKTHHHQDHIFPQRDFSYAGLRRAGVPEADMDQLIALKNRIGNLQLLTDHENTQKSAKEFKHWVRTRNPKFRRKHLIPTSRSLYSLRRFESFLIKRENLIRSRLKRLFA